MTPRVTRLILAAICAATALTLHFSAADAQHLKQAEDAGVRGDYLGALRAANKVNHEPSLTRSYAVRAYASLGLGDAADSVKWFKLAQRSSPDDFVLYRDITLPLYLLGRFRTAKRELAAAKKLNPLVVSPARPPR